jgi:hypothetical protein
MKTTIQTNIANLIFDIVTNKGTCFAGFDYHGKRRNLTLGANLANRSSKSATGAKAPPRAVLSNTRESITFKVCPTMKTPITLSASNFLTLKTW